MVNLTDVENAYSEIQGTIHKTPILTSKLLNKQSGNQVYLKSEHLQKTGSFKIRGATNAVRKAVQEGARFITAASSGNHGQAVASIAKELGVPCIVVVPEDANTAKVEAIKAYQGHVEYCGFTSADRLPRAKQLAEENNGVYIPPYDHPHIIAGQGTVGLELLEQVPDADIVVVPIGGGGLISGILTAVKNSKPHVKVIGVEPEAANDTYLSLKNRQITSIDSAVTIADGLRTSQPGDLTFPIMQKHLDDLLLVSEEQIKAAFQFTVERTKQLIEPSSAAAVAAVLSGELQAKNQRIVVVLSGGNLDLRQVGEFMPG